MLIRLATAQDLPDISRIYDAEVLHGIATFDTQPRPASEQIEWFAGHAPDRHPLLVASDDADAVLGWASLSPWSTRCAYARAAETSVYVDSEGRGRGIGKALMIDLIARAGALRVGVLLARIVEPNPASLRLHESLGFETIGVMRRVGEKFGRILDARLMDLHLDAPPARTPPRP